MEKTKVVGYARVSGKNQVSRGGFDRQAEKIEAYCKNNNYELDKIFNEQVSGTQDEHNRPIFMEMLKYMHKNEIKLFIIEAMDRFVRDSHLQRTLLMQLVKRNIDLIDARSGKKLIEEWNEDPSKKLVIQIMGDITEFDKDQLKARLKAGREKKLRETGKCSGRKLYGEHPKYPDEKETIKKIIYLRRLSRGQDKVMSFGKIAAELNSQGLKPRSAPKWTGPLVYFVYRNCTPKGKVESKKSSDIQGRLSYISQQEAI